MSYKRGFNGTQGEDRTRQILGKRFKYSVYNVDIDGADFGVELLPDERIIDYRNRIQVTGRVQAKFFENNNEVKIAQDYVEDEEGVRTDFFALLHTNEGEDEICYFFDAQEIKDNFKLRDNYYVFSLSKKRKFEHQKSLKKSDINDRIEAGIRGTEEYRNQRFIQQIASDFSSITQKKQTQKNPVKQVFENSNRELIKKVQNKSIVDKLYIAISEFNDFRRIISWCLVNKLAFRDNQQDYAHYNQFTLSTNNSEIHSFFDNIELGEEIIIKDKSKFNDTSDCKEKVSFIIKRLNENLIFKLNNRDNKENRNILLKDKEQCNCLGCNYDKLAFSKVYSSLTNTKVGLDLWKKMQYGYAWYKLGKYEIAKEKYIELAKLAEETGEQIIYFFAKYNHKLTSLKNFDYSYPDLDVILDNLNVEPDKKEILKSISENTLFNSYAKSIDDIYLKIKDYKQRRTINDTADLINKLYPKIFEYINFTTGNWLVLNESQETDTIFEKVIECFVISFSMKSEYSYHLDSFNDAMVELAIHHCDSNKLLSFFQRNNVRNLPYKSDNNYFKIALDNFFSKENVDFLYDEICYFDNRTKNPGLGRKVRRIFSNICILLSYLEFDFEIDRLLDNVIYFISKLDFNEYDIALLANPLLSKSHLFSTDRILKLIQTIESKEETSESYLVTNCLYTLVDKGYTIADNHDEMASTLIKKSISSPRYGLLNVLPKVLNKKWILVLKSSIEDSLKDNFNYELYYSSIVSGNCTLAGKYFTRYIGLFDSISKENNIPSFFNTRSPFTGINEPLRSNLNRLVEVLFILDSKELVNNSIITEIANTYPYYKFMFNQVSLDSDLEFNVQWVLENQTDIVLSRLGKNLNIKSKLKEYLVSQQNNELLKIYVKYFS